MQYSVVKYSEIQKGEGFLRLDSEHYKKTYLKIKNKLESKGYHYLHEILSKPIVTGHTPSMSNDSYYGGDIAFIKTDNVREHNITDNVSHYLTNEGNKKLKRSQLEAEDILLTIIGANFDVVGRASLVTHEILPANINQNIALIRLDKKKFNPKVLSVYLNSFYGRNYIYYLSRQTEQVNLNNKEVERLVIPKFSQEISNLISDTVEKSYQLKLESKSLYNEAENLLLEELGLKDWKPKHQLSYIKNYSDTQKAERFDAEYFQPKYEEIIEKIKSYKNGCDYAKNLISLNNKNYKPKDDKDYRYIELSNISQNGEVTGFTNSKGQDLPTRARRKINNQDLILSSIEGSLDSISLITNDYNNMLCSTGFFVANSQSINPETMLIFFKSIAGQLQLKKGCSGTILTAISADEFNKILLPLIDNNIQEEIKNKVKDMYLLKRQSKTLLETAKKAVEMAIESNEEQAISFIDQELEKLDLQLNSG